MDCLLIMRQGQLAPTFFANTMSKLVVSGLEEHGAERVVALCLKKQRAGARAGKVICDSESLLSLGA